MCLAYKDGCTLAQLLISFAANKSYQRFGNAITASGNLNLRHASFANDFTPIDADCSCECCRSEEEGGLGITRAYIYHVASKETAGAHLYAISVSIPLSSRIFIDTDMVTQTHHTQRALPALSNGESPGCYHRGSLSRVLTFLFPKGVWRHAENTDVGHSSTAESRC